MKSEKSRIKKQLGMEAHGCNPSTLGSRGRGDHKCKASLGYISRTLFPKINKIRPEAMAQPVILTTQGVEVKRIEV